MTSHSEKCGIRECECTCKCKCDHHICEDTHIFEYDGPERFLFDCMPTALPVVSVGSGLGTRELLLGKNIITVDPNPYSFQDNKENLPCLMPKYSDVNELLKHNCKIQENCSLCLFHPYPSHVSYPTAGYDYDAILSLKPQFVLIMVCKGDSGSLKLWEWIQNKDQCRTKQDYILVLIRKIYHKKSKMLLEYMLYCKQSSVKQLNIEALVEARSKNM